MSDDSSSMRYLSPVPPAIAPALSIRADFASDRPSDYFSRLEGAQMFDPRTLIYPQSQFPKPAEDPEDETPLVNSLLREHDKPYRVTGLIGSGGFADVYKGFDVRNQENVAVKLIQKRHTPNPELRQVFFLEPLLISNLNHPNIIDVYDYIIEPRPLHVMKYVPHPIHGPEALPIDDRFVLNFLKDMSCLLEYFERQQFMHSDIKPANIRVTDDLDFKLMDFGGALFLKYFEDDFLRSFTPTFASPEVVNMEAFSTLHDVYSFGRTLGTVLTGKNLSVPAIFILISEMYQTDLPWSLREIIGSTTQGDYRKRPSARELVELVADYERETEGKQVFRETHVHTFWEKNWLSPLFVMGGYVPGQDAIIYPMPTPTDSQMTTRKAKLGKRSASASTPPL